MPETGPLTTGANLMIAKGSEHILFLKQPEDGGVAHRPCGRQHVPLTAIPPRSIATDIERDKAIKWTSRLVGIQGLPEGRRYPEVHAFMSEAKGLFWDACADFVFRHHLRGYTGKAWMEPCSRWLQGEDQHLNPRSARRPSMPCGIGSRQIVRETCCPLWRRCSLTKTPA